MTRKSAKDRNRTKRAETLDQTIDVYMTNLSIAIHRSWSLPISVLGIMSRYLEDTIASSLNQTSLNNICMLVEDNEIEMARSYSNNQFAQHHVVFTYLVINYALVRALLIYKHDKDHDVPRLLQYLKDLRVGWNIPPSDATIDVYAKRECMASCGSFLVVNEAAKHFAYDMYINV